MLVRPFKPVASAGSGAIARLLERHWTVLRVRGYTVLFFTAYECWQQASQTFNISAAVQ